MNRAAGTIGVLRSPQRRKRPPQPKLRGAHRGSVRPRDL